MKGHFNYYVTYQVRADYGEFNIDDNFFKSQAT